MIVLSLELRFQFVSSGSAKSWKRGEMFKKLIWTILLASFALLAPRTVGQPAETAYLRVLHLGNDGARLSVTFEDGRTVITNLAPGSSSDYAPYVVNRSTLIRLTFTPQSGAAFNREWSVPPLSPEHYTAVLVGSIAENTLQLTFVSEDALCEGVVASGSCIILVNSVRNSPPMTLLADNSLVVDDARYRHVVVNGVPARSYLELKAVDPNNPQTVLFRLQRGFFEPNVIALYSLTGDYARNTFSNLRIGSIRRVPVDTMTFLRGLTANLNLSDGTNLFAAENIVAVLDAAGYDSLLENTQLPLTVFAPTDAAILEITDLYECALSDPAAMRTLILNHILAGAYTSAQLVNTGSVSTMAGTTHTFRATPGGFFVDNTVRVADSLRYPTATGNVYLIDTVLVPEGFADQYCAAG